MWTLPFNLSVTTSGNLVVVTAPATATVVLVRAIITGVGITVSEQPVAIIRRATTAATGGTLAIPNPTKKLIGTFPGTVRTLPTGGAAAGVELVREGFNLVGSGFRWLATPNDPFYDDPTEHLAVRVEGLGGTRQLCGWVEFYLE